MNCPRCAARGKPWEGGDPKCAFPAGTFQADNWNCATLNAIRDLGPPPAESEGQRLQVFPVDGRFIVLGWYKNRGAVEVAQVVDGAEVRPLALADAEERLAVLGRGPLVDPDGERYRADLELLGRSPGTKDFVGECLRDPAFARSVAEEFKRDLAAPEMLRSLTDAELAQVEPVSDEVLSRALEMGKAEAAAFRGEHVALGEWAMPESQDAADVAQAQSEDDDPVCPTCEGAGEVAGVYHAEAGVGACPDCRGALEDD